ncbi:MAG: tRNA lysidine(34) synthetase TilS [Candidatus Cloacimonetes bacterium]|nr:tRNA lysidine(34) synthetase TilS [Candidatus Cloacimonadota bacterium]
MDLADNHEQFSLEKTDNNSDLMIINNFLNKFENYFLKNGLIKKGFKIIVGFSGGSDSTALMIALKHFSVPYKLKVLAAHVNYGLRGDDSEKDEEFCRKLCNETGLSIVVKKVRIFDKSSIENKAREIRFDFFDELTKVYKMNVVALGHNQKDQAETILFRLARGSGLTGLRGIQPVSGNLIHPLLSFSREEIVDFLKAGKIEWTEDKSNYDNEFTRNKFRNEFIPWLEENANRKAVEHIYNTSVLLKEAEDIVQETAKRSYKRLSLKGGGVRFNIEDLMGQKQIIRFYIYRQIMETLTGDSRDFYSSNFEELESIFPSMGSKIVRFQNGVVARKEYNHVEFIKEEEISESSGEMRKELNPRKMFSKFGNYRIQIKRMLNSGEIDFREKNKNIEYFDFDRVRFPIYIRYRMPGDSFRPLGLNHRKKLKDFFIDEKIPKFERDSILIFTDAQDRIIWVGGYRIDQNFAVTEKSKRLISIQIEEVPQGRLRSAERITDK